MMIPSFEATLLVIDVIDSVVGFKPLKIESAPKSLLIMYLEISDNLTVPKSASKHRDFSNAISYLMNPKLGFA